MLPKTLIKGIDQGRLRNLLLLFFLALAVPTAVLIGQAFSQLKWASMHQYRVLAEELTDRIDARLIEMVNSADDRSFTDYTFLVVAGEPSANLVQRSALSDYPVASDLPGTLGYFQVGSDGAFSTPLLPAYGSDPEELGISSDEYSGRSRLARELQSVLADNRLVKLKAQPRLDTGDKFDATTAVAAAGAIMEEEKETIDKIEVAGSLARQLAKPEAVAFDAEEAYSQQVFDRLNRPREDAPAKLESLQSGLAKTVEADGDATRERSKKRLEQSALPEALPASSQPGFGRSMLPGDVVIRTFESEVDPLEFSMLDSGHIVLFRKVWRDGERYIQGLIVEQDSFFQDVVAAAYRGTVLAEMSELIVAYQDSIILDISESGQSSYPNGNEDLDGSLLYRSRLSTPLDSLELIFKITRLPPGPGASVLGWVTLVLAIIFAGGFVTLYRLGVSQINLARQQQDFVSAVSHELKTPLTSIRMYGEMLKEGWADENKKQDYYEFIHDESERLTRLISNVLRLARITRNEPEVDMRASNVGELMNQVESKISSQVERASFELEFKRDKQADSATLNIDSDCFVQIIINLVDNAIKFSKNADNKRIEIASKISSDGEVAFSIRDFGPGIPKDQMKKIFTLFYRSESELTRETVGTGIGLAIVHQLVIAMNGKVDVVNKDPGAEFRVSFPS